MKKLVSKIQAVFRGSKGTILAATAFALAFAIASWVIGTSYLNRYDGVTEGRFNPEVCAAAAEMQKQLESLPDNPVTVTTAPAEEQVKKSVTTMANPVTTGAKVVATTKSNPVETTGPKKVATTRANPATTAQATTTTTTTTLATTSAEVVTTAPTVQQQVKKSLTTRAGNPAVTTATTTTATVIVTTVKTTVYVYTETVMVTKKVPSTKTNPVNKDLKNPVPKDNPVSNKQVGTLSQNPVNQGTTNWPWKVYIPEHQGFFYAVSKTADVESLKNFNGVEYPNPGWYDVPAGVSLKVESQLVFGRTLYSVLHDEDQIAKLLEYNETDERTYSSPLKVPVGLALNIVPMDVGSVEQNYNEPNEVVISEVQTITREEVQEVVEEQVIYVTAAPPTETEAPETETEALVPETTTEAENEEETTSSTTATTTVATTTAAPETTCTPAPAVTGRRFDGTVFDAAIRSYAHCKDVIGFAIGVAHLDGTPHEELYSFNGDKLFPTNCTGKIRYIARSNELMSTRKDKSTGQYHTPYEYVTITKDNFIARNNSTVLSEENGHYIGELVQLCDAEYWSTSASCNVSYELDADAMKRWYGEDDKEWLAANYGRVYFGQGRYGYQTPSRLLIEAMDTAKYMFSDDQYAWMIREWISKENAMLDSHIATELADSGNWSYIGYKIGWYSKQQMELIILKDVDGNVYCVVAMTMKDGDQILPRLGDAIDNKATWAESGYTVVVC